MAASASASVSEIPVFETNPNSPPRPFAVASWLGMTPAEILAGLADGSIAPPPGAASDWRPPGLVQPQDSTALAELPSAVTSDGSIPSSGHSPVTATPPVETISAPDRAQVQGWFQALDSKFTAALFDGIWSRAGESDPARAQNLTGYLARTLLGTTSLAVDGGSAAVTSASSTSTTDANAPAGIVAALSAFTADPSHKAHIVDLAGMDGAHLARLARTDVGYRYALAQLDSVAITGNRALFAAANTDGALDRFDPDSGEVQLSDAWLGDRAKFLAWKMAGDAGNDLTISGSQSWTFIDRTKVGADGEPLTLKLTPATTAAVNNQVIFGGDSAEDIKNSPCHFVEFREVINFVRMLHERPNHPGVRHQLLTAFDQFCERLCIGIDRTFKCRRCDWRCI